jgi:ankyrin repeat protein
LSLTAEYEHISVVKMLLENGAKPERSMLREALERGGQSMETIIRLLLEYSVDLNEMERAWSVLHDAAYTGSEDVIRLLVKHGADTKARYSNGWTALHPAALRGHTRAAQVLLEYGIRIDAKDENGWTALHIAATRGDDEMIELLLDHGAELDWRTQDGKAALYLAASAGHESAVRALIHRGANIEASDNEGKTALHIAAQNHRVSVVKPLLTHGAVHSFALGRRKEGAVTAGYLLTYAHGEGTASRMPSVLEMMSGGG